jgi:hypothetical protein
MLASTSGAQVDAPSALHERAAVLSGAPCGTACDRFAVFRCGAVGNS